MPTEDFALAWPANYLFEALPLVCSVVDLGAFGGTFRCGLWEEHTGSHGYLWIGMESFWRSAVSPIFFSLAILRCLALSVVYAACSSSAGGFLGGSRLGWEWFACITLCFLFMVRIGDSAFLLAVDCFL
jgi:hypothetical protein